MPCWCTWPRTCWSERRVWADRSCSPKRSDEPRLANSRLAGEQHDLSVAVPARSQRSRRSASSCSRPTSGRRLVACSASDRLSLRPSPTRRAFAPAPEAFRLAATEIRHVEVRRAAAACSPPPRPPLVERALAVDAKFGVSSTAALLQPLLQDRRRPRAGRVDPRTWSTSPLVSCPTASTSDSPARIARSASSSWACG